MIHDDWMGGYPHDSKRTLPLCLEMCFQCFEYQNHESLGLQIKMLYPKDGISIETWCVVMMVLRSTSVKTWSFPCRMMVASLEIQPVACFGCRMLTHHVHRGRHLKWSSESLEWKLDTRHQPLVGYCIVFPQNQWSCRRDLWLTIP